MDEIEITVTRQQNGLLLSTIFNNQYYKKLYVLYSEKEAREDFVEYVKAEDTKIFRHQDLIPVYDRLC